MSLDALLRETLKRHPDPVCTAALADDIVRRVMIYESRRRRRVRRALMIVYWIAFAIATAWALRSLPLPEWKP